MENIRLSNASRFMVDATTDFKTRSDGDDLYIEGYFSVFNSEYKVWDDWTEVVKPGAFRNTLMKDDIRALVNHDTTLVLGRNRAGTLELHEDEYGLFGRVKINPNDQDAMNLYARVQRGDVTQCSFGFDVLDCETEKRDSVTYTYLTDVKLFECSVCTFPAYTATAVQARNAAARDQRIAEDNHLVVESWKAEQLKKLRKE